MKNIFQISVVVVLLNSVSGYSQDIKNFYSVRDSISGSVINKHLQILAHDSLEGRGVGSKGIAKAAEYISQQFSKFRLERAPSLNNFYQNIQMHGSMPLPKSELILIKDTDTTFLKYSEDYFLYRSGQQTFIPVPLDLVFVGYGIVAPEYDHNDYQSVDVIGKIVVFIDGEPESDDMEYFKGTIPTIYSYPESKRRIAISRGAAGTIQINLNSTIDWETIKKEFSSEDVTLAYSVSGNLSVLLNTGIAEKLFEYSDYTLNDIMLMHQQNNIRSFNLNSKIKFKGVFRERDFISQNVIGYVKGSDPELQQTYLLVSAHYDHLGIGLPVDGDSIYNGALDNAIGVSVMLELASAFAQLAVKPKRSVIFIATTGEEKGLLGSSYYVDHPVFPLHKTITNINIDGIAMFRDFTGLVSVGTEYSTLDHFIKQTADRYDLVMEEIPPQFRSFDAFNKSDQLAFALGGIPSVLVLEGLSNRTKNDEEVLEAFINYYLEKYHTPFDDLNQVIDTEAAARHAKILFDLCFHLADQKDVPEWKSGSPFINARLRSIAQER